MYGLTFSWRLRQIESVLAELWEKHSEYLVEFDNTVSFMVLLKICPYHQENANLEEKKEIRENQKECPDYPRPNFFLDGYCYHYREPTGGHCDRWKEDDE